MQLLIHCLIKRQNLAHPVTPPIQETPNTSARLSTTKHTHVCQMPILTPQCPSHVHPLTPQGQKANICGTIHPAPRPLPPSLLTSNTTPRAASCCTNWTHRELLRSHLFACYCDSRLKKQIYIYIYIYRLKNIYIYIYRLKKRYIYI